MKKIFETIIITLISLVLIPNKINAEQMSDEFKSYLNEEGKLIVRAVKDEDSMPFIFDYLFGYEGYEWTGNSWEISDDLNSVKFTINTGKSDEESHTVDIEYIYDEKIKEQIDEYMDRIPEDLRYFEVRDLEIINYWVNGGNIIDYSSHLKSYIDYKNFSIDFKSGGPDKFQSQSTGEAKFQYDDTIYAIRPLTGVSKKHIIYIDESVENTKEAVINAVQKRIDDYIGEGKVNVLFGGESVYDLYMDEFETNIKSLEEQIKELKDKNDNSLEYQIKELENTLEQEKNYKEYFLEEFTNEDGGYYFLNDALNDWYFLAEVNKDGSSSLYHFIVKKDSSKMINPTVKTVDAKTNIEITTEEALPLDTTIKANELKSGSEYNKIVKILNLTDNIMYDLKLYSNSLEENITKLPNGTFEVKVPVPENLRGKDLKVYYVNENGLVEEPEVKPEGNYIIFYTDHFSIYTLGYKDNENSSDKITITFKTGQKIDELSQEKYEAFEFLVNKGILKIEDNSKVYNKDSKLLFEVDKSGKVIVSKNIKKSDNITYEITEEEKEQIDQNLKDYSQIEVIFINEIDNPKTYDGITNNLILALVSLLTLSLAITYLKKYN